MNTNVQTSNKKCKLRTIENNLVLCSQQQLPVLFTVMHSPQVKQSLNRIFENSLDYEDMLKTYQLSFDLSQLPSDEAMLFLEMTEKLRATLRDIHSFNILTNKFNDEKAA